MSIHIIGANYEGTVQRMRHDPLRLRLLFCCILFWQLTRLSALSAQESTLGESVYKVVSEAVFLLEVLDDSGQVSSIGTAFLIADRQLVTNHHVVARGRPHLRVGSLRLECTVEKSDAASDLALLRIPASVAASPLHLATTEPPPGSTIFAISNPAGLERTITHGLVSGVREIEGQRLLHISASISPGSSGGPVVDSTGAVVGVVSGYLEEGQNLNFAVPAPALARLLRQDSQAEVSLEALLHDALQLHRQRSMLSLNDRDQRLATTREIESLLKQALTVAGGSLERLVSIAQSAEMVYQYDLAIEAARSALKVSPPGELRPYRVLANSLDHAAWFMDAAEQHERRSEALRHAQTVVDRSPKPFADDLFLLARLLELDGERRSEAFSRYQAALAAARTQREDDLRPYLRGLFRTSIDLNQARKWFDLIAKSGGAEDFDWESLAERYEEAREYRQAAQAWLSAAEIQPTTHNLCSAGFAYWLADDDDAALSSFRRCVDAGVLEEGVEQELASAHSAMSAILFGRGVYDQSIASAKQALALQSTDAWAYLNMSKSLNALGRNSEAAAAAESAIRLSDGKFAEMHFALGSAYFDQNSWERAERAFEKAAELNPADWTSAYNTALCLQRQRFYKDAARWYEEVLRRKPDHPEREDIMNTIRKLRQ